MLYKKVYKWLSGPVSTLQLSRSSESRTGYDARTGHQNRAGQPNAKCCLNHLYFYLRTYGMDNILKIEDGFMNNQGTGRVRALKRFLF